MSDSGSPVPTEQALKVLQGVGGFLREMFGTVPEDLVGYFGGDWLKVRRAENAARLIEEARERLRARNQTPEPPSMSIVMPLLIAAADEDRDELRDIWARLLAAAADPTRAKAFRLRFIETVKQMDPLDAAVLQGAQQLPDVGRLLGSDRNQLVQQLNATSDEIEVSVSNLIRLGLAHSLTVSPAGGDTVTSAFGREFLRAVSD
jgi:hypothetical protein